MPTSYAILSEEIQRIYSRGISREDISPRLDKREVKIYIVQAINSLIKAEIANIGEIPDTVLGTYSAVVTNPSGCLYQTELPVIPINLPKNMGIWRVYPDGCPWRPFVPIKSGDFDIAQGTPAEALEGLIGYYQDGKKLSFTKNPGTPVILKLVVNNPTTLSDTELLPIPAEMETLVINEVLKRLASGQVSQYELNGKSEQLTPRDRDQ